MKRKAEFSTRSLLRTGRWQRLGPVLLAVAIILFACKRSTPPNVPIKIGVWGAFSGGSSPVGSSMLEGAQMEIEEINKAGGILGRKLELVSRDDEGKNERSAQVIQQLIFNDHVDFLIGPVNTGSALASLPFAQRQRIPVIIPVATGTELTRLYASQNENYVFRVAAYDSLQTRLIAETAVDRLKCHKPAILADSTNYGQLGRADLESALSSLGVRPTTTEKFDVGDIDMAPQVQRARESGADVLLLYGIGPELAQIANARARLGWQVPLIGCWNFAMSNFISNAGVNAEGAVAPEAFIYDESNPIHLALMTRYKEQHGGRIPTSPIALAQSTDAVLLLAAAIRQAGTTDGSKVIAALENLTSPVQGVITTYRSPFNHQNHEALSAADVQLGIVRGGKMVPWTH